MKKMLTTYVFPSPSPTGFVLCTYYILVYYLKSCIPCGIGELCASPMYPFSFSFISSFELQAIKTLNMIKLYGKPIRVNKVRMILCSWSAFP